MKRHRELLPALILAVVLVAAFVHGFEDGFAHLRTAVVFERTHPVHSATH